MAVTLEECKKKRRARGGSKGRSLSATIKVPRKFDWILELERKQVVKVDGSKVAPVAHVVSSIIGFGRSSRGFTYAVKEKPFRVVMQTNKYLFISPE